MKPHARSLLKELWVASIQVQFQRALHATPRQAPFFRVLACNPCASPFHKDLHTTPMQIPFHRVVTGRGYCVKFSCRPPSTGVIHNSVQTPFFQGHLYAAPFFCADQHIWCCSLKTSFWIDPSSPTLSHGMVLASKGFLCKSEHFMQFLAKHFWSLTDHPTLPPFLTP